MPDSIKVAVVVPVYNAAATLSKCLNGLIVQSTPGISMDIIVVDDGSTDDSARIAAEYSDCGVTLLQTTQRGAAAARNTGFKAASQDCTIILFTDADCVPAPDWAWQMVTALQNKPLSIVGVKGVYRTKQKSKVARFVQSEYEERYQRFAAPDVEPEFADTYAAAYRRSILADFPFDERLPGAIVEDAELGWRLRRAGYHFGFAPQAVVYHKHAASLKAYFRRKFQIGRWRLKIYQMYPDKLSNDNHTSQSAKLQMVLLGLTIFFGICLLIFKQKRYRYINEAGGLACGLALQLSYFSFMRRSWITEPKAAPVVWLMLNVRTAAYSAGAIVGLLEVMLEKAKFKGQNRVMYFPDHQTANFKPQKQ